MAKSEGGKLTDCQGVISSWHKNNYCILEASSIDVLTGRILKKKETLTQTLVNGSSSAVPSRGVGILRSDS